MTTLSVQNGTYTSMPPAAGAPQPTTASQVLPQIEPVGSFQHSLHMQGGAPHVRHKRASEDASQAGAADPLSNPRLDYMFDGLVKDVPPSPRDAARQFAKDYLKQRGIDKDPDQIFLTTHFPPSQSIPKRYDSKVMSMTDMVLQNRQPEFMDSSYGLVHTDLSDENGKSIPALNTKDFQNHIWYDNFAAIYQNRTNAYFDENKDALVHSLSAGLAKTLTQQVQDGSLTREGADIVSRGLGVGPYKDWHDRELEDFTHRRADSGVVVKPLKINGAVSTQAFLFTQKSSGKTVLYLPGNERPYHEFNNQDEIADWFVKNVVGGSDEAKAQFKSYFPADTAKYVDAAYYNLSQYPERVHQTDYFDADVGGPALDGDIPDAMLERLRQDYLTQGKEGIVSDEQWGRRKAVEAIGVLGMVLAPIALVAPGVAAALGVGLGAAQMGLGVYMKTHGNQQEQEEGRQQVAFGFLNAAGSLVGMEAGLITGMPAGPKGIKPARPRGAGGAIAPDTQLRAPGGKAAPPSNVGGRYEAKLNAIKATDASRPSMAAKKADFEAGLAHPETVELPFDPTTRTLPELQQIFVDGEVAAGEGKQVLTYKQLGALSAHINRLDQAQSIAVTLRKAQAIMSDWKKAGAVSVIAAPQDFVLPLAGEPSSGRCLPLVRSMAVALEKGQEAGFSGKLFLAAGEKQGGLRQAHPTVETLQRLHNAGAELERAGVYVAKQSGADLGTVVSLLEKAPGNVYYELNTSQHSMLVAKQTNAQGTTYVFYDPNFGLARFDRAEALSKALKRHFIDRKLGDFYGHVGQSSSEPRFNLKQIDPLKMANFEVEPGYTIGEFVKN